MHEAVPNLVKYLFKATGFSSRDGGDAREVGEPGAIPRSKTLFDNFLFVQLLFY